MGNRLADSRTWKSDWSDWKDSNHGSSSLAKVLRSCSEGDCHREDGGIPSDATLLGGSSHLVSG